SLHQTTDERRSRYFAQLQNDAGWSIRSRLIDMCEFKRHNLLDPMPNEPFDCIFIRNVFIYFDKKSKEVAVQNLIHALAPGGFLVVGPADGIYDLLGELNKKTIFLYQKPY
ncbi:MAG: protein-glutamate O-methyltransferase CheR, partial [Planctomycetaceae bacterium]|nr:protein-glutamate O-methyltransferase CheR [Planctomycetaceae bacterium]